MSERIRAGIDRVKAKGTTSTGNPHGRPRAVFRRDLVAELRGLGLSWAQIGTKEAERQPERGTAGPLKGCQKLPLRIPRPKTGMKAVATGPERSRRALSKSPDFGQLFIAVDVVMVQGIA